MDQTVPASIPQPQESLPPLGLLDQIKKHLKSYPSLYLILGSICLLTLIFLAGAFFINTKKQDKALVPIPSPTKTGQNPSDYQLVVEGIVEGKNDGFLTIKESGGLKVTVYIESDVLIKLNTIETISGKNMEGIISTRLLSNEEIDYSKILVKDKIRIVLDKKDEKLFAKLIIITREE